MTICRSKNIYRPCGTPTTPLLFGTRSVGFCVAREGWRDGTGHPQIKPFVQIFWTVRGEGVFRHDKKEELLPPGSVYAYFSGDRHLFGAASAVWSYRFFTIDGPLADKIVFSLGLKRKPHFAGICPHELFQRLSLELNDITLQGQRKAVSTAFQLLTLAGNNTSSGDNVRRHLVERCVSTIDQRYCESGFNINELARILGIHRSRLSREFKQETGMTLIQYLSRRRIQRGLSLLKDANHSVSEIARLAGFDDSDYFARIVKKTTGQIPSKFRR